MYELLNSPTNKGNDETPEKIKPTNQPDQTIETNAEDLFGSPELLVPTQSNEIDEGFNKLDEGSDKLVEGSHKRDEVSAESDSDDAVSSFVLPMMERHGNWFAS